MAVNISDTVPVSWSRLELLKWVNESLQTEFKKIDDLCTGAAYCQLMDVLFEGCVPLRRVFYWTNNKNEYTKNFKLLQSTFNQLKISKHIPVENLIKGRYLDNFQFLLWFRHFFVANYKDHEYDALAARNNMALGLGPVRLRRIQKQANPRSNSENSDSINDEVTGDANDEIDGGDNVEIGGSDNEETDGDDDDGINKNLLPTLLEEDEEAEEYEEESENAFEEPED